MEAVGWVAAALVFIAGVTAVVASALDQLRMVLGKFGKAVRALGEARDEVRRFRRPEGSGRQSGDDRGQVP